jgi:hypothetical protein
MKGFPRAKFQPSIVLGLSQVSKASQKNQLIPELQIKSIRVGQKLRV